MQFVIVVLYSANVRCLVYAFHSLLSTNVIFIALFISFMATAVLIFRMFRTMDRKLVKYGHVILHTITLVFSITAFVAIVTFKNDRKKPYGNFYTFHSWIGLLVLAFYVIQVSIHSTVM